MATVTSADWSDECLIAEASFVAELEAIETSSVAPALESYLATVVSTSITNYCEPTNAPAIVSAEWRNEVVSIDAIINVYSADIATVKSCLASYQTAAGTPYALAPAASAIFSTISSLEACTYTVPSTCGAANATSTLTASVNAVPTGTNRTATSTQGSIATHSSIVTAGAASQSLGAIGFLGLIFTFIMSSVAML